MNAQPSLAAENYDEQLQRADQELAAFIGAVAKLYGSDQARLSAEDWLEEAKEMDRPPRAGARNWRAVTVAASARLANRLNETRARTG